MSTLATRKAELVALLRDPSTNEPLVDGVDMVWDHLNLAQSLSGGTDISVFTAGVTAEFWQIGLRVRKNQGSDPKSSQDELDLLLPAIDVVTNNGHFGPSRWDVQYPAGGDDQSFYVATQVYEVGREDF